MVRATWTDSRRNFLIKSAAVAAAGTAVGAVGSCSSTSSQGGGSSPTEITYWHVNSAALGLPALTTLVDDFNQSDAGVQVKPSYHTKYPTLVSDLQTALAGHNPPDVAQIGYPYMSYVDSTFPYFSPDDAIKKYGPNDYWDSFPDNVQQFGALSNDKRVGVPYAVSNPMAYYNADLLDSIGVSQKDIPSTWSAWADVAEEYKNKYDRPLMYIHRMNDNWGITAMLQGNGSSLTKCENGNVKSAFNDSAGVAAIQFWRDLIAGNECLNTDTPGASPEFLGAKIALYIVTSAQATSLPKSASFEVGATMFPTFAGHEASLPAGGNVLVIFAQDEKKQEAAWKFVQYLTSKPSVTEWVQGTGYLPVIKDLTDDPDYLGGYYKSNALAAVAESQLSKTVQWQGFPGPRGLQASADGLFNNGIMPALSGQKPVKEALDDAATMVNEAIEGQKCNA